jgi:hypothetical protein
VDDGSVAELNVVVQHDVGHQFDPFAQHATFADVGKRMQTSARANGHVALDHDVRPDRNVIGEHGGRVNDGSGMDPGIER